MKNKNEYTSLLESLEEKHIIILKILKQPEEYDKNNGNLVGKGGYGWTYIESILKLLLPDWDKQEIKEVIIKLETEKLIKNIYNNWGVMITNKGIDHLEGCMTEKGIGFCRFIDDK